MAFSNPAVPKTSVSLILRVGDEGDVAAWEQFCAIYQPLVYRIAISRGLQPTDAHDLVQEVMSRVARSVNQWEPDVDKGTFRGWISRIAKNLVVDFLRKQARRPLTSDQSAIQRVIDNHSVEDDESDFDLELRRQIFLAAAKKVQPQFAASSWQAFWRTAVLNQRPEQVAESLRMTTGAVYVAKSRVMAKLKSTAKYLLQEF